MKAIELRRFSYGELGGKLDEAKEELFNLRFQPEFRWVREGAWLDTLLGTRRVRPALERGDAVADILAADGPSHERFVRETRGLRLY